ncbi:Sec14p-like phosphatidylinositol transfer family protein [Actinidia rufa]|uniref:Sec14p-like phosphatidylinositol transfer family protein n=1 Tax=Actinidia rufa TaxID=165716 RepID=A0A7J0DZ84_9ERIC|nr:Sec14p-like phosphatidylinositol transfer family protein [Actinidia rufa]
MDLYRAIRDSQLMGMSGYTKEGLPVIAVGLGLSTFDKASPSATEKFGRHISSCVKVIDLTGLKLSALNHIKLLTVTSTIDDLNYPEKTDKYYVVNAPYICSACWKGEKSGETHMQTAGSAIPHGVWAELPPLLGQPKTNSFWQVVRPLLQERTRDKVKFLPGCGREDLLEIMDYASLPHFCKREGSGSSRHSSNGNTDNCFSLDHVFYQQLYDYIKRQAALMEAPIKQGSFHVDFPEPDPEGAKIAETIESEFQRLGGSEQAFQLST